MSRWLAATVLLAGAIGVAWIGFLNAGPAVDVKLGGERAVHASLGVVLAAAFAAGAALVALLASAAVLVRRTSAWAAGVRATRAAARLRRDRLAAETLLVGGEAEAAHARLADAVTAHGPDAGLLDLLAGAAEQSGNLDAAVGALEQARTRLPDSPVLARRLRALYAAAGRWEEALALQGGLMLQLGSSAALAAETRVLCGLRYEAALADADPSRALRRLLALAREHPEFVPPWVDAGDRLRAAGRRFRARRVLERGARVRPAWILLDRLAALDADAGNPDRTRRTLRRLRRRHPDDPALLARLVHADLGAGALDDAEAALASWPVAGAPAPPALEALRGELCRRRGQHEQAAVHLARVAEDYLAARPPYRCRACGDAAGAWSGRCARCGRWDTLVVAAEWGADAAASASLIPPASRSSPEAHCVETAPG